MAGGRPFIAHCGVRQTVGASPDPRGRLPLFWSGQGFGSAQFAIALAHSPLFPSLGFVPFGFSAVCEIAGGLLILVSPTKHTGAGLILVLSLLFAMVLSWALANGIIVSCSCFGQDDQPSAMKMMLALGRDLFLAGLALVVILERELARRSGVRRRGDAFPL